MKYLETSEKRAFPIPERSQVKTKDVTQVIGELSKSKQGAVCEPTGPTSGGAGSPTTRIPVEAGAHCFGPLCLLLRPLQNQHPKWRVTCGKRPDPSRVRERYWAKLWPIHLSRRSFLPGSSSQPTLASSFVRILSLAHFINRTPSFKLRFSVDFWGPAMSERGTKESVPCAFVGQQSVSSCRVCK